MEQSVATTETTPSERATDAVTHSPSPLQAPDSHSQDSDQNTAHPQEIDLDEQLSQTVSQGDPKDAEEMEIQSIEVDNRELERACQSIEHHDDSSYQEDAQIGTDVAEIETAETPAEKLVTQVVDRSKPDGSLMNAPVEVCLHGDLPDNTTNKTTGEKDNTSEQASAPVQQEHNFVPDNSLSDSCQQESSNHQQNVQPTSSSSQSVPETETHHHHELPPVSITSNQDWSASPSTSSSAAAAAATEAASLTRSDPSLHSAEVQPSLSAPVCEGCVPEKTSTSSSFSESHPEWSAVNSETYVRPGDASQQQQLVSQDHHSSETMSFLESLADPTIQHPIAPQSQNTWPASLTSLDTLAQGNDLKGQGEHNTQIYHSAPVSCSYTELPQLVPCRPPQLPPGQPPQLPTGQPPQLPPGQPPQLPPGQPPQLPPCQPPQLPPCQPPQIPPGQFMSPPPLAHPSSCPVSLPDLLGVSPENAMQRFVQEPGSHTSQSFSGVTVMSHSQSGPPSNPPLLQPPVMLPHPRSDSVMPHHPYDAMQQHTTMMSHSNPTAPYSHVDGFATRDAAMAYPMLSKLGSLAAMLPPLSTMMPQSNAVDTMMPYHKRDITPHYQNCDDMMMTPPPQPPPLLPQPPIQHHDILSAAVAHTIGLPQHQDQGQDPESYPPPLVHPPDNPYPPMLALPEEPTHTPLRGPTFQNFSPPFPSPYPFRGPPHPSPQTYHPRPRRMPRRGTPRMRTPARRGGPRKRTPSIQYDIPSDLDLSDFSPGHWAHLETEPDEPIILEIDPSQRPKSLLQAINMYIDFLIWENQKKVKIDEDRIIPMPCDFDNEEYYINVMSKPTPFPTAKLRSWLKLYNVDIEITDPEGNVMSETTFASVMTTSSPVTPVSEPVTRDSVCDDSSTTRYVMHWYMNDPQRGAEGNVEMGVPGVEGPLASGPAVFGNCGVCSPPLGQVTGAQPWRETRRNPDEQNAGSRRGVAAQGFSRPQFTPRSSTHRTRYSTVGMKPSRKHPVSTQVSNSDRGHRRGRWHSSRFSRESPQSTTMRKTPQSLSPIGQPAVTHWAPICTPQCTAGVSRTPDMDVVTVYPSNYIGSRARAKVSPRQGNIQEISSDGPNKVYILRKRKVSQGSQTERSYTVGVKRMKLAQGQKGHPEGRARPQGQTGHPFGSVRQESTPCEDPGPNKGFPKPLCSSTPLKEVEVMTVDFDKEIGQKGRERKVSERKDLESQLETKLSQDAEPMDQETVQVSEKPSEESDVDVTSYEETQPNEEIEETRKEENETGEESEETKEVSGAINAKDNAKHCLDYEKLSPKAEIDCSIVKSTDKEEPKVTRSTTRSKQRIFESKGATATRSLEGNLHKDNSDCGKITSQGRCLTRSESAHSLVSSRGVPEVRITRLRGLTTHGVYLSPDQLAVKKPQKLLAKTKQENVKNTATESEDVKLEKESETRKRPRTRLTGLESPPKKIRRSLRLCTGSNAN